MSLYGEKRYVWCIKDLEKGTLVGSGLHDGTTLTFRKRSDARELKNAGFQGGRYLIAKMQRVYRDV